MSEEKSQIEALESEADQRPEGEEEEKSKADFVPREELERVMKDMHKFKSSYKELQEQFARQKTDELKKREEWQQVAEMKEKEAHDFRTRYESLQESLVNDRKFNAVREKALAAGIRQEALQDLELLDFDEVAIETTSTGRVNVIGADKAIQRLKTTRPYWFGRKTAGVNTDSPSVQGAQKITYEDIMKAEKKAKESGDYEPYKELVIKYRQQ